MSLAAGTRGFCPAKLKQYSDVRLHGLFENRPDWVNAGLAGRLACYCGLEPRVPRKLSKLDKVVDKCPRAERYASSVGKLVVAEDIAGDDQLDDSVLKPEKAYEAPLPLSKVEKLDPFFDLRPEDYSENHN